MLWSCNVSDSFFTAMYIYLDNFNHGYDTITVSLGL